MGFWDKIKDIGEKVGKYGAPMIYYPSKAVVAGGRKLYESAGGDSGGGSGGSYAPEQQYYGGSPEAAEAYRKKYEDSRRRAAWQGSAGVEKIDEAANRGAFVDRRNLRANQRLQRDQGAIAAEGGAQYSEAMGNYGAARDSQRQIAGDLQTQAMGLPENYKTTSDQVMRQKLDQSTRATLSAAAGHGAGGLRTALATAGASNADAVANSEVTRANELNQLEQMKQQGLVAAAGVQGNVGAQDQGAASIASARETGARSAQGNLIGQAADINNANTGRLMTAGTAQQQTGLAREGMYLGAQANMERPQLASDVNYDVARQMYEREMWNRKNFPIMSMFNQA